MFMHIILKNKFLYFGHYKIKCAIGKRGISKNKRDSKILVQVDMNGRSTQGGCSPDEVPGLIECAFDGGVIVVAALRTSAITP